VDLRPLRTRLSLLGQGLLIGRTFGTRSLAGLLRMAELVQQNLVEPGSFTVGPDGVEFLLRNPPLRPGAFYALRAFVDTVPVAPDQSFLGPAAQGSERSFAEISRENPIGLEAGVRQRVRLRPGTPVRPGAHTVRLELRNVAIPLTSWLEFSARFRGRR
jgi:hypothetical protein